LRQAADTIRAHATATNSRIRTEEDMVIKCLSRVNVIMASEILNDSYLD
jgi:hypothetical protein